MIRIIKENKIILIFYGLLLMAGIILHLFYSKTELHLFLNRFHSPFSDFFFANITHGGNGILVALVIILFGFIRFRWASVLLTSFLGSGIVVQLLKRFVFSEMKRPAFVFKEMEELYFVPGIDLHHHHSFPSGHSATAFALFFSLAFIIRDRLLKWGCFILACVVAYSRVYLSQHFLGDIFAGSLIGLLAALIFYWYFQKVNWVWIDLSFSALFRKRK